MKQRAQFVNPNHLCSFNSLTHCLYNLEPFRNCFLETDYNNISEQPYFFLDPSLEEIQQPDKIQSKINYAKSAKQFCIDYQQIFRQMNDPTKRLDLSNLIDTNNIPLLKNGAHDPFTEFLAVLGLLSNSDKPFFMNHFCAYTNKLIQLFTIPISRNFKDLLYRFFLSPAQSSILSFQLDNQFYNFQNKRSRTDLMVIHSLPDILLVSFAYSDEVPIKELQTTVDFTNYVQDHTKSNVFRINSFILMLHAVHAIAYVRLMETADTSNEKWLICNDIQQKVVGREEVNRDLEFYGQERQAIIGFYERKP